MWLLFFFIAGVVSFYTFDKAGDGRWYHQPIILLFKHGWNPIYSSTKINLNINEIFKYTYPYANELLAYAFVTVTNSVQVGKMINILFAMYGFCMTILVLDEVFKLQRNACILIASYIAFNPFFTSQYLTFYVDANLLMCYTVLLFSSILWFHNSCNTKEYNITFFALLNICTTTTILLNIKTSGVAYAIVILGIILGVKVIFEYYQLKKSYKNILAHYFTLIIVLIGFEIFMCWHPYVQNLLAGKHVFWPIMGDDKLHIAVVDPNNYSPFNWSTYKIINYLISYLFPYPIHYPVVSFLPNVKGYVAADYDSAALGPFWCVLLVVGLYVIIKYFRKIWNDTKCGDFSAIAIMLCMTIVVTSIIINPYWIYMRYVPQVILIPAIALIVIFKYNVKFFSSKVQKIFIVMFLINSGLFFAGSTILVSYRTFLLNQMEHRCKLNLQCVLDIKSPNIFEETLINDLQEKNVSYIRGSCETFDVIWRDAKANGNITNVMCVSNKLFKPN